MTKEVKTNPYIGVISLLEEKVARELKLTAEEVKQITITVKNGEVITKQEKQK